MNHSPMTAEALRVLVENRLHRLLAELPPGWPDDVVSIGAASQSTAAVIRVGPRDLVEVPDPPEQQLRAREREMLDLVVKIIRDAGGQVQGDKIHAGIVAAGRNLSRSTINIALAEFVATGYLQNDRDRRGYRLPPETPKVQCD